MMICLDSRVTSFKGDAGRRDTDTVIAVASQSRLLCFVVTAITKLATCHRELSPRARVCLAKVWMPWPSSISSCNSSLRLSLLCFFKLSFAHFLLLGFLCLYVSFWLKRFFVTGKVHLIHPLWLPCICKCKISTLLTRFPSSIGGTVKSSSGQVCVEACSWLFRAHAWACHLLVHIGAVKRLPESPH